jgi:hypothetical protein
LRRHLLRRSAVDAVAKGRQAAPAVLVDAAALAAAVGRVLLPRRFDACPTVSQI